MDKNKKRHGEPYNGTVGKLLSRVPGRLVKLDVGCAFFSCAIARTVAYTLPSNFYHTREVGVQQFSLQSMTTVDIKFENLARYDVKAGNVRRRARGRPTQD